MKTGNGDLPRGKGVFTNPKKRERILGFIDGAFARSETLYVRLQIMPGPRRFTRDVDCIVAYRTLRHENHSFRMRTTIG